MSHIKIWLRRSILKGKYLQTRSHYTVIGPFPPHIFRVVKSRRMGWMDDIAHIGDSRGVYRDMVRKPEGKKPLGRPRHRWEDNIKMDLQEVGWIELVQDRDRWRALVNAVMNFRVS